MSIVLLVIYLSKVLSVQLICRPTLLIEKSWNGGVFALLDHPQRWKTHNPNILR